MLVAAVRVLELGCGLVAARVSNPRKNSALSTTSVSCGVAFRRPMRNRRFFGGADGASEGKSAPGSAPKYLERGE